MEMEDIPLLLSPNIQNIGPEKLVVLIFTAIANMAYLLSIPVFQPASVLIFISVCPGYALLLALSPRDCSQLECIAIGCVLSLALYPTLGFVTAEYIGLSANWILISLDGITLGLLYLAEPAEWLPRPSVQNYSRFDIAIIFLSLIACLLVLTASVTVSSHVDRWQYAKWLLESQLISTGAITATCGEILGVYPVYLADKICTRLRAPFPVYATVTSTRLTGLDFTGSFRHYFIPTAIAKFLITAAIIRRFTRDSVLIILGSALLFVGMDYSPLYLTQAKGLSLVFFLAGIYTLIRWQRGDTTWIIGLLISIGLLSVTYAPRALLFLGVATAFIIVNVFVSRNTTRISAAGILAATIFVTGQLIPIVERALIASTVASGGLGEILMSPSEVPYQAVGTTPLPFYPTFAVLAIVGGILILRRLQHRAFAHPLVVWPIAAVLTYLPAGLLLSFFRSRVVAEASYAAAVLFSVEVSALSRGRLRKALMAIAIIGLFVSSVSAVQITTTRDGYSEGYGQLVGGLDESSITSSTPVYTDLKTGAYLLGEGGHREIELTYPATKDSIKAVWHGTNATAACQQMGSAEYFILSRDVYRDQFWVGNHPRRPISDAAYNKFSQSPDFSKVDTINQFVVYKINNC
ncbi:hypothetical protein M0R88_10465 [Halorussus gelatinilyticus]|uniref:Uncharacterized protein n=1 Tax=Halorussus gelatinilyticus TaxID=2937524 RepID=A0A8U0IE28_9EURY|nr:hypothetical protein [Halorussus gelatinilyticus]UPV98950.1 hypothetical protein M0R88_10465 [Halorussus gelatinilyticus]